VTGVFLLSPWVRNKFALFLSFPSRVYGHQFNLTKYMGGRGRGGVGRGLILYLAWQ